MSLAFRVRAGGGSTDDLLFLERAIDAKGHAELPWLFQPKRRGVCALSLEGVESKFPFGFIIKSIGENETHEVPGLAGACRGIAEQLSQGRRFLTGHSRRSAGLGSDLLNIREYQPGDPPRLVHWKATARLNQLMVRQLAQEGEGGFHLEVDPDERLWDEASFELLCSLACSLAEDLFHLGRLESVCVLGEGDFDGSLDARAAWFFDRLAVLERSVSPVSAAPGAARARNRVQFRPSGERGVSIFVDDAEAGQAER